ncbi:MAG: ribosomal-protein-alanine N-acetyltransferase [Burkholderiales bacterium]|nr:MAG: ribosomal-protein-alanine N-acetyltransferase [Burkholderiales bacterium]
MRVRPMRRRDLDAVAAIERSIYPFPWTRGNFADSLLAGHDAWIFELEVEESPQLIGYAIVMWVPDEVHLLNLSVAAPMQGRGYGREMLRWLMRDAAGRGARGMLLEVRPSNAPALALYRSSGFEAIGVRRGYYPAEDGREDAHVLFRQLGS